MAGIFFGVLLFAVQIPASPPVKLENIRYYSYPEYTRVVLDLSGPIQISERALKEEAKSRLFFDLKGCRLSSDYPGSKKNEINVRAGNLNRIRIGSWNRRDIRVVFDFDKIGTYNRFYLPSPFRIVFDIYRSDVFVTHSRDLRGHSVPETGQPSMARQLGLGVHRIVVDPGHGGKDPGTVNSLLGIREKELTLDIAKRLQSMLREHAEFEIILTRNRDEYLSLEERTAIANSSQGDLFLSIHINSAPRKDARGVETYFLNITTDPWAMSVAAQENAMSSKSIGELRTILDRIMINSTIEESKILSTCLQDNIVGHLRRKYNLVDDLGVKKAPFYVLLGAKMPSALIEASFLSCTAEAERLGTPDYRNSIAAGIYLGVTSFIQSLGK